MALEMPIFLQALPGDPEISYTGQQMRQLIEAAFPLPGVTLADDLKVTQRGAGANMSVDVAAGQAAIRGTSIARQGTYIVVNTAVENVALRAAHATLPRVDLVVARVFDKQVDGGTEYAWRPAVVTGTPLSSPQAPSAPATSIRLAEVRVNATAPSVVAADITDRRQLNMAATVPAWQARGGNGAAIPTGESSYVGTLTESFGVDYNATTGEAVLRTPGQYLVSFSTRYMGGPVNTRRAIYVELLRNGTALGRVANHLQVPATIETDGLPMSAAGLTRVLAGDVIRARRSLSATATGVTQSDTFAELIFTGVMVGP